MIRRLGWCVGLVLVAAGAEAPNPDAAPGKLVEDIWESAQIDGARVGSVHSTVEALDAEGRRLRTTVRLELTFKRHNGVVQLRMEQGDEETPDGAVLAVFMRQFQGQEKKLDLSGALEDGRMHVRIDGGRIERRLPWADDVVGVHHLAGLFAERKPKPGDQFMLPVYQPTLNAVVPVQILVKEAEDVALADGKKSLLRAELRPERIEGSGVSVQLPPEIWWLDSGFTPVRRQLELEGLGTVLLTRTTRELAAADPAARLPDLNQKNLIPLNRIIPNPHATRAAIYRVTLRDDPEPGTAFVKDGHQDVAAGQGGVLEVRVHPVRPASGGRQPPDERPAAEYLESSHFIDCDDVRVKEAARRAVGAETDPWKKAQRIERWVKQNMRPDDAAPMGSAGQAARDLRGDCRLYALLTAAMCRAEGVPARISVGLLYVEKAGKPYLGFHMWTEAYIEGRWLGLDGTLGLGAIGADHLKVADHSWHGVESLTPLLPVGRILGKTAVEVVSAEAGD